MSRSDEFVHGVLHRFAQEGEFYHGPRKKTYRVSDLTTRGRASGKCESCAQAADHYLSDHGVDSQPLHYEANDFKNPPFGALYHRVSQVNIGGVPHAVDYTFNQFHPGAPVPVVEPVEEFDKRMAKKKYQRST